MSLPAGVKLLKRGRVKYYTQRVTAPPMVDCMFAALCTPLSFMGYGLAPTFVGALRKASGVPLRDAAGRPQGTTTAASRRALRQLLPDAPVRFGGLDDETMLARLNAGEVAVRLVVANQKLPRRLRRFVGRDWVGLHAVALGGARRSSADGRWEVRWMDPAGRPGQGYDGEFVPYADVRDALRRTPSGKVCVTYGEKNAALVRRPAPLSNQSDEERIVKVLTNGRIDEFATIPRGTPFLHPETGAQVTTATEDAEFRLAGRSSDGRLAGVWVNTRRIPGASGLTLLLVDVNLIGEPFVRSP